MDNQKQQVVERLQQANNILVTVSSNPSVDQLAACIGITLALNKMGKHATAVFSGDVPSTIEFLQPERTIEKNTDSLRDFIIALDKSKADKLRYKVEDRVVKIFITPYRTSISNKDLEFSQGDFNVEVVIAIGVHAQADLDQAITSHGRILHDATVMTLNTKAGGELGSINWIHEGASSLSEIAVELVDVLDKQLMDGQIATALLTGIVAETNRFSNQNTSPQTMSMAAELMAAGANQQLVATKLEEPTLPPQPVPVHKESEVPTEKKDEEQKPNDGTIEIAHESSKEPAPILPPVEPMPSLPEVQPEAKEDETKAPQIHIDEHGQLLPFSDQQNPEYPTITPLSDTRHGESSGLLTGQPPMLETSPLTASALPGGDDEDMTPSIDPLSAPSVGLLDRQPLPAQQGPMMTPPTPQPLPAPMFAPTPTVVSQPTALPELPLPGSQVSPAIPPAPEPTKTLSDIEQDVHSPHLNAEDMIPPNPTLSSPIIAPTANQSSTPSDVSNLDDARQAVEQAINSMPEVNPEPVVSLNAQPMNGDAAVQINDQGQMTNLGQQQQPPVSFEPMPQQPPLGQPPMAPPPIVPPPFPGA